MGGKLTYASVPSEVKKIANESLGFGFFRAIFDTNETFHLMLKVSEGEFVGFALYHFRNETKNGESFVVGVIDCICVSTKFRGQGFGTLLTFGVLRKMSVYGADRIEMFLKTPQWDDRDGEPGIPFMGSEKLLLHMGFKKSKIFKKYYYTSSRKFGYDCSFCGNKPDTCTAVLYTIEG